MWVTGQPNEFGVTRTGAGAPSGGRRQGAISQPNKFGVTPAANPAPTSVGRLGDRRKVAVHYIFGTHNRRPVFEVGELRALIGKLLLQIAAEKGLEVIAMNVLADHVHILARKDAQRPDSEVMKLLKGASARYFFLENPEVKEGIGNQSLWAHRYFSRFVASKDLPQVLRYIENQTNSSGIDKRYLDGLPF